MCTDECVLGRRDVAGPEIHMILMTVHSFASADVHWRILNAVYKLSVASFQNAHCILFGAMSNEGLFFDYGKDLLVLNISGMTEGGAFLFFHFFAQVFTVVPWKNSVL